jgi:hypothetical protein
MLEFLQIFESQSIWEVLLENYQEPVLRKIEECSCINGEVGRRAEEVLKIGELTL